jgi:hypothetical protein
VFAQLHYGFRPFYPEFQSVWVLEKFLSDWLFKNGSVGSKNIWCFGVLGGD